MCYLKLLTTSLIVYVIQFHAATTYEMVFVQGFSGTGKKEERKLMSVGICWPQFLCR
jgi:hypothetical protein